MVVVIVFVKKKLGPKHFSQKNLGQNFFDPKQFWSKNIFSPQNLGCPKIIKVKKSLIQKMFGTTKVLCQKSKKYSVQKFVGPKII